MSQTPIRQDPLKFHAGHRPEAEALIDLANGERLTYRELEPRVSDCALRLAEKLAPAGGKRLATLARNSADQAIIAAATERCGIMFAPLNWRLTANEIAQLLADCEPDLVLADAEFEETAQKAVALAKSGVEILKPGDLAGKHLPAPKGRIEPEPAPYDAPCILLYTSGTTGKPKGVVITRENAFYSSLNFSAVAMVGRGSRLLCDSPLFHTVGLVAVTRTALQQGGCVVLSDRFLPHVTVKRLSDPTLGITHYFAVPQMIEALLREPEEGTDLTRLVALFSGGGPLSPDLIPNCARRGVKLINGFGMSEVGSAIHMPVDAAFIANNMHTVGYAAPWIDVMLADEHGKPVKQGEVGEIWMRGPSVSPGYWRQKEATEASYRGEWFCSGDMARQEANGAYAIVDRKKDMYISGGENVYPAEVEAVLRQYPGVKDAAVIGVVDARWGEVGVAFIELAGALTESELRAWWASRLARFKQPQHVRLVPHLPRTGSGKVRKDLLRKDFAAAGAAHAN